MSTHAGDIQVDAVLCEGGKAVMLYVYKGDDVIVTQTQRLPILITEDDFEEVRVEWEQAWMCAYV